jgi:hypothetical protein
MLMRKSRFGVVGLWLFLISALVACGAAPLPVLDRDSASMSAPVEVVEVEKVVETGYREDVAASNTASDLSDIEPMIVWNASISLMVEETKEAMAKVGTIAKDLGGRTVGSESWLEDEQLRARMTIRIPTERFDEAMAQLRDLALKVNHESANSEDVTDQYVDLESRLRHLEAKEAQLLEFLGSAEDTEAALAVYEHLAQTQGEIEQVKGRMEYLRNLSAMATISVDLYPEEAEPPVVEEGWKPGRTLRDAARALVSTLEGVGNVIIWFAIYLLPVLLVIAIPVALVVWAVRRRRRRRKAAQEQA